MHAAGAEAGVQSSPGVPGICVPDGLGIVVGATRNFHERVVEDFTPADELGVGLTHFPPLLGGQELLLVEHFVLLPDVVDCTSDLVSEHCQGLAFAVFTLEPCVVLLALFIFSQESHGCLAEGPLQVHVADLSATRATDLAGRLPGTLDQPRIGGQFLRPLEAVDVVDLIEHHQREDLADPRHGAEPIQRVVIVILGGAQDEVLELPEHLVVVGQQPEIDLNGLLDTGVSEALYHTAPVARVGELLLELGQVVLAVGVLDVGQELGAFASEVQTAPQEIPGGPHLGRVDVGLGDHATAQQGGDLQGIDPVVLGLTAVDGFHVESVAQDEGDLLAAAQVGEPVPGEHAFDRDY